MKEVENRPEGVLWTVRDVSRCIRAYHPRPKTRPAYIERALWGLPEYRLPATSRHDLDNVVKITLDALQIARVVSNDRCIVSINAGSYFVAPGEDPRVDVVLREVTL